MYSAPLAMENFAPVFEGKRLSHIYIYIYAPVSPNCVDEGTRSGRTLELPYGRGFDVSVVEANAGYHALIRV